MSLANQQTTEVRDEPGDLYEAAHEMSLDKYLAAPAIGFARNTYREVTDTLGNPEEIARVADIHGWQDHEQLKLLLVYEDGLRQFVGEDDTAKDAGRFSFVIDPVEGDSPVRTADEALGMLKPPDVTEATVATGERPGRQGEWWLLPAGNDPESRIFKPGVRSKPYGGSPLENHVPREYALGVPEEEFMRRFRALMDRDIPALETPADVFGWAFKQVQVGEDELIETPDDVPEVSTLRELAEDVYVRGTLRHRENDHYLTKVGDQWHRPVTHDVDVYTPETETETSYDREYEEGDDGWMEPVGTRRTSSVSRRVSID